MATPENETENEAAAPAPKKRGWLLISLIALVLLGGGGGAAWFFVLGPKGDGAETADAEHETHGEPVYFTLAENLVVNFRSPGGTRFLQVGIDLMTYDADAVHALEKHAPVLRSDLILLLSDQSQETLLSREGKEALREEALAEVRRVMTELNGKPAVESLYFTSFVMQ